MLLAGRNGDLSCVQRVAFLKDIPDDLMVLVRAAQLSGGFCQERAIASAIGRERARCRQAVEEWRTRLTGGDDLWRSFELLLSEIEASGVTPEQAPDDDDDAVLIALRRKLHEAATVAERQLLALPDYADIAEEVAAIEAVLQPGEDLADRILCLSPMTFEGYEALQSALLWKRGEYIGAHIGEDE